MPTTCLRYELHSLSDYFEEYYFKPARIKQWASWYRLRMFNCEWLLDTNMHTESWHNVLKTSIMERHKNHRVDELMRITRSAETMYYCKWARTQMGMRQLANPDWICMRGETPPSPPPSTPAKTPMQSLCQSSPEPDWSNFLSSGQSSRSKNYKKRITDRIQECLSLLETKAVENNRLQAMLRTVSSIRNALRNSPDLGVPVADSPLTHPRVPVPDDVSMR